MLRIIIGQNASTPIEALRAESGIPSYKTHSKQLVAISYEKGMRMQADHPRRIALDKDIRHRLKTRTSCREEAQKTINTLSIKDVERKPITIHITKPWNSNNTTNWSVHSNLDLKDKIPEIGNLLNHLNPEVTIYTDGSCTGGQFNGGAAAIVTGGDFDNPSCIEVLKAKGNKFTCSYDEEWRALDLAIGWMKANKVNRTAICTDSLSLN